MIAKNINWDIKLLRGFAEFFFQFKAYLYQEEFLNACLTTNRIAAKWPRQSGKSFTVSVYALFRALTTDMTIIIVAPTQSQSGELYKKVRDMAMSNPSISRLIVKSTETEMRFKTGARIISLPCGPEGKTIRGYTADIIIIEEAGIMKDVIVNTVIIPMIASKGNKGQIIKIGTPWLRNHFYRSCYEDRAYTVISINWKQVLKAGQYSEDFINEQKAQLTDIEFRTEYDSEFIDDSSAFFPGYILQNCKLDYIIMVGY